VGTLFARSKKGFKFDLKLQKHDKQEAIRIPEGILSRLKP
jgi:hypothetical protein